MNAEKIRVSRNARLRIGHVQGLSRLASFFLVAALVEGAPGAEAGESAWITSTLAGKGVPGRAGDGGAATSASLDNPFGVVRGPDGALYVCEYDGNVVRRIDLTGIITTVAGSGRRGPGGDGGPALDAEFDQPHEVRFDGAGNLFVADMRNHRIRRIDVRTRIVTTVAGNGEAGFDGDGGLATRARLRQPHSIQFGPDGNLYVCDIGNHRVRRVDMSTGIITTAIGNGERGPTPDGAKIVGTAFNGPRTLDFDRDGGLWLALREGNQVFRIDLKRGVARHIAGTGAKGFTGHGGPAREATLSGPKGIAVAPDGDIYLADTESHSIRKIDVLRGTLELVAGTGEKGDGPDGPGSACRLARPHGVFVGADGSIYVGDSENHRVRVIRPAAPAGGRRPD